MNSITDKIRYLPATDDPLSADVYLIEGERYCYIYDVGNNDDSLRYIGHTDKEKIIILSHYHKDHTGNIGRLSYHSLYVGGKTYETIGKGVIVETVVTITDGVKIEIIPCPSPHTEGSLIINLNHEYTFIADLYFTRLPFNQEKALQMIETLRNIDTRYFVISHQEKEKIVLKDKMISELSDFFGQ